MKYCSVDLGKYLIHIGSVICFDCPQTDPEANPDFSGPITDVLLSSFLLLYAPVTQTHASASEAVSQASDYSACDKSTSITSTSSSGFGRYIGWISLSERYQFFGSASARYR